uniref:Negatively light-regulated protein n=1 Tax=Pyramimonas obovata TaxID=1411642 RepID=A0A7S0RBX9_9CHLO|mmetsp:Transcript_30068/g.65738  ORF Transcript_30068/g.65738 Transcript_30068/m.65738 type:complete len:105 (+) Transcript_30068:294-608(+)|eukprot:CAMPEP_0118931902 /NCGR_PEP_ID=MMETSP1169-20130426/8585_1 /TAXON_ID=36882 /ORGANISM="Pyramimonas obovata, Strain CCMP722" /LENGTH=104 /DNA_ID=CAMNT_0006874477 /DNA_START=280 /DNA_END=594 /DNA_ORIENTATION=+
MEGQSSEGLGTRALAARALAGGGGGKYGAANPKAKLIHKDVKYFDSADWALQKEGKTPKDAQPPVPSEAEQVPLQPKLQRTSCDRERRASALSHQDHQVPMDQK